MVKYFTSEGLEKLKKELNYLKTIKRKEIAERLKNAISFGDLRENFAYQQAKEEQSFLEGRILELEKIISQAKVIKKKKISKKIEVGSIVWLLFNKKKKKFQIVEPEEVNLKEGKISLHSLLGKAILGKKIKEKIKIETPDGEMEYKIIKIE